MRSRWVLGVLLVGCRAQPGRAAADAGEPAAVVETETVEAPAESTIVEKQEAAAWARPVVDDPGVPEIGRRRLLDAPQAYEHLTLRAGLPVGARYEDLVYEGNNKNFRGKPGEAGLYRGGDETAADWRRWIAGVKGMVVLRDSLFSQQDHPVLQTPRALMLPPNWVSVAVARTLADEVLEAPVVPALDDDAGWAECESAQERFGSFPASARLFEESRRSLVEPEAEPGMHARTRNARRSIAALGEAASAMLEARSGGAEEVARAGAEWISASDRTYFGAQLRTRVIPIFVELPNEHEARDEGKGMGVWGWSLSDEALRIATEAVYARRLEDGPLGVERYDLRHAEQRARAIRLLEVLIPRESQGHPVWLWVNGGSDGHGRGDSGLPHLPGFQAELAKANIEPSRLVLLSKPSPRPRGADAKAQLDAYAQATAALGVPASVQLNTRSARRLFEVD